MSESAPRKNGNERLMPEETNRLLLVSLDEPPMAQAYHHWDSEGRNLVYAYNGRKIISIHIPGDAEVSFRHGSDGNLQSWPLVQQAYVIVSKPVEAEVTFQFSSDAVNMRPGRAKPESAIIGQTGRPLISGVNGLYDIQQDLLVSWHGRNWRWLDESLAPGEGGNLTAGMQVELGPMTWVINIKPHYYRLHLGYQYHKPWQRRPKLDPIVGWCTWEAYRRNLSEERIVEATEFFAKHLRPYGMEYIQIDDGFEPLPLPVNPKGTIAEAWMEIIPQFPTGHCGVIGRIRSHGMKPGIWTTSAIYNDDFADEQPDCLIRGRDGKPILGDWVRYILDCTEESLAKHVKPYYVGLREFGYEYFKVDCIRHLLYDGLQEAVLLGLMSNDEAEKRFRRFLEVGREGIGEDTFWLSSWGQLSQMVGLCDACRISQDAMPNWSGMQMQLVESARWFFTQRILYMNDPDHVCVRAPFEWARSVLSMVSITGGLFMLSDALHEYDEKRLELIRKCIPPLKTFTAETGPLETDYAAYTWTKLHGFAVLDEKPFDSEDMSDEEALNIAGRWPTVDNDHPFSSLWAIHLDSPAGKWCVMGRFATLPLRASTISLEKLSLDPGSTYLAFDFWEDRYLGVVGNEMPCPPLKLGHCQIISLRKATGFPQLLSSTRHISMDAVSVKEQSWNGDALTLKINGVCGRTETYWIHVPRRYELGKTKSQGLEYSVGRAMPDADGGRALPFAVTFPAKSEDTTTGILEISFEKVPEA